MRACFCLLPGPGCQPNEPFYNSSFFLEKKSLAQTAAELCLAKVLVMVMVMVMVYCFI